MTTTETLEKIVELTNKNLEILKMINESFYSKRDHLSATIDGTTYIIPSYIALENKVNYLQSAFDGIVNLPQNAEAYMNFDGNSRVLQLRGYQQAPPTFEIDDIPTSFCVESSSFFKDMVTPKPYLKFDISHFDIDINSMVVRKVTIYNTELIDVWNQIGSTNASDQTPEVFQAMLDDYTKDEDYSEYETVIDSQIIPSDEYGDYIVKTVLDDTIDTETLLEKLQLELDRNLTYQTSSGEVKDLEVGDILTTYNGTAQLVITDMVPQEHIIEVQVLKGEFVNIMPDEGDDSKYSDYSILRFWSSKRGERIINVPLEEDQYVFIMLAGFNNRIRVRAPWSKPILIDTSTLTLENDSIKYSDYYKENVKNIGDQLAELTSVMYDAITKYTKSEFDQITSAKPLASEDNLQVVRINKHLDDTAAIRHIKEIYSQKQQYKHDLNDIQKSIAQITEELAMINFDDMSGVRELYMGQINDLKKQQDDAIAAINRATDEISLAISSSEVPLTGAKYRIRGYVDVNSVLDAVNTSSSLITLDDIVGVKVRYRYLNPENPQANINTIGDYVYTDWVELITPRRPRTLQYKNGKFITVYLDVDTAGEFVIDKNNSKFNQVDIPIQQGEQVEIQTAAVYGFGYPFTEVTTEWSESITIPFPDEYNQDVTVKTIIEENNSEIETLRFNNILTEKGIVKHVDDHVDDQNKQYFHNAENITSSFYTDERRVIPLSTKLQQMNNAIIQLQDDIMGTYAEVLQVSVTTNNTETILNPIQPNTVYLPAWNSVNVTTTTSTATSTNATNSMFKPSSNAPVTTIGSINLKNISNHTLRLFSLFPGSRNTNINKLTSFINKGSDFQEQYYYQAANDDEYTQQLMCTANIATQLPDDEFKSNFIYQRGNQFITFRIKEPFAGDFLTPRYERTILTKTDAHDILSYDSTTNDPANDDYRIVIPVISKDSAGNYNYDQYCIPSDNIQSHITINPGESIQIPILIGYVFCEVGSDDSEYTIGFDLRNSLYSDPQFYQCTFKFRRNESVIDTVLSQQSSTNFVSYNPVLK